MSNANETVLTVSDIEDIWLTVEWNDLDPLRQDFNEALRIRFARKVEQAVLATQGTIANAPAIDQAQSDVAAERAVTDDFIKAVNKLVFMARTSGGTSGRDDELCAALDAVEDHLRSRSAQPQAAKEPVAGAQGDLIDAANGLLMRYVQVVGNEGIECYKVRAAIAAALASAQPMEQKPAQGDERSYMASASLHNIGNALGVPPGTKIELAALKIIEQMKAALAVHKDDYVTIYRLQRALNFWLPRMPAGDEIWDNDVPARIEYDSYLLCGFDPKPEDEEKCAEELGITKLLNIDRLQPSTTGQAGERE
jgi:hypothetical protein